MAWSHVALYRAMNLGHRGSPVRTELEAALLEAGAQSVRSFQTNGTVLLEPADGTTAESVVRRAAGRLSARSGYAHPALVRPLAGIAAAIDGDPFARTRDARTYRETLTFVDGGGPLLLDLPWTDPRDLLDLVAVRPGVVLAVVRGGPGTGGDPNAVVEQATGGVATTRTLGTVRRLLAAAARA